jgi:hypothetical protein
MTVILVRDPAQARLSEEGNDAFWPLEFDAIVDSALEDVLAEFDVVIPADDLRVAPRLSGKARVALHCVRLEALEHLVSIGGDLDIIFSPSLLTCLDRYRSMRSTLLAARAMDAGHRIVAADLATETGGAGMSAELKDTVIGRVLLYDLPSGSAIDFGMIGERGEEPA